MKVDVVVFCWDVLFFFYMTYCIECIEFILRIVLRHVL